MKLEDIPTPIVWALNTLSRMNDDRTTVLHLDETMTHPDGWLPTMNLRDDDGFYPFPAAIRDQVATFFGPDFTTARTRVTEVNAARGVTADDAQNIMIGIFRDARTR